MVNGIVKQKGFGLIGVLLIIGALIITAGGVVVWRSKVSLGPTALPTQFPTPTPTPSSKPGSAFPTEYFCNNDSDCVIKKRPFCCGESLQYYNWCYHKDTEPETISCKGIRSCPGVVPITSCVCQDGKCTFPVKIEGNPYTWPVEKVCVPNCGIGEFCADPVKDLGDGTYLYRQPNGSLFRGTANQCRCLASSTLISTPGGEKVVKDLKPGMLVWTLDRDDKKVVASIVKVSKVPVSSNHLVSHLILADGRKLFASPEHPTADGKTLEQLSTGDILDESRVVNIELIPYQENYIYDILPEGETGLYLANGILLKSTLVE